MTMEKYAFDTSDPLYVQVTDIVKDFVRETFTTLIPPGWSVKFPKREGNVAKYSYGRTTTVDWPIWKVGDIDVNVYDMMISFTFGNYTNVLKLKPKYTPSTQ